MHYLKMIHAIIIVQEKPSHERKTQKSNGKQQCYSVSLGTRGSLNTAAGGGVEPLQAGLRERRVPKSGHLTATSHFDKQH